MDCQQDIAINTIIVLDEESEYALKCRGNAEFRQSMKIYDKLHIQNDIRTCGNIIPLSDTACLGTNENQWMDINAVDGTFNKINVDVLNVKQLNIDKKNHY